MMFRGFCFSLHQDSKTNQVQEALNNTSSEHHIHKPTQPRFWAELKHYQCFSLGVNPGLFKFERRIKNPMTVQEKRTAEEVRRSGVVLLCRDLLDLAEREN